MASLAILGIQSYKNNPKSRIVGVPVPKRLLQPPSQCHILGVGSQHWASF